ncbi:MAG TPA: sugar ABC transporter substrate-binding protein [Ktedonobacteraceae bacterium]|nr:sugar ABC transporter substrate-binding protein [Ktedonobacteraceae bacterium]
MKLKNVFMLALLMLTMGSLAACGGGSSSGGSGNVTSANLTVWGMGAEGDSMKTVANDFMKQNPGIHVTVQSIPWANAHQKLLTAVAGTQTPDVSQMGTTWMTEFAKTGALDTTPSSIDQSAFFPSAWKTAVVNGTPYGVPWYVETRVLYYRTDIAQKAGITSPPKTWDDLLAAAQAMKQKGGSKYGIYLPSNDWQTFLPFVWQNSGKVFDNGSYTLNSPQVVQALSFYQNFFKDGLTPQVEPPSFDEVQTFDQGSTPMFFSGPWSAGLIKQEGGASMQGKWAIAPMPQKVTNTSFVGGSNMVVFKNSPNRAAAWKFVQYLSDPTVQTKWYNAVGDLPSVQSAWNSGTIASDKNLAIFHTQLGDAQGPPSTSKWEEAALAIDNDIQSVMLGKSSPDQAAQDMQQKATSIGVQ